MYKSAHTSVNIKKSAPKQRSLTPSTKMPSFTKTLLNSDALMKNYVFNLVKNMYPKRPTFLEYENEAQSENSSDNNSNSSFSSFENISPKNSFDRDLLALLKVIKPLQPRRKNYNDKIDKMRGRRGAVVFLNLDETI